MKSKKIKKLEIISFAFPVSLGREIEAVAEEEHRTPTEFIRELFERYQAIRVLRKASKIGQALAKKHGVKPEDLGGPFED